VAASSTACYYSARVRVYVLTRSDVQVVVDVLVPSINGSNGVFAAARVDQAGCTSFLARGIYFFLLFGHNEVVIATDLGEYG